MTTMLTKTMTNQTNLSAERDKLLARRRYINREIGLGTRELENSEALSKSRTLGGDMDDALYALERDTVLAVAESRHDELLRINRALAAIDLGTWGECVKCARLIEADRMVIDPSTETCIRCQREIENTQDGHDSTPSL